MRQFEHPTLMDQAESLAISVSHALELVIQAKGWAVLAVSGGKSPVPMFERLRYRPIRWDAVTVTLVDERAVPPDHADSNGALVRNTLLREAAALAAFVPAIADAAEAVQPARAVERLNAAYQQPDVVVLGMGEDGHTASLFPDAPELQLALSEPQPGYVVTHPASAPHARVTLNLAALLAAERTFLAIAGEKKGAVLAQALEGPTPSLPVSLVLARHRHGVDIFRT
ncbi:6-phosphogluconolactonase [Cupriavidus plantarum]|uniref:6-phosphogluconolactonase n=1 Tax=Cupriavidus plantarum TaxID=942865 RepID=A0A316ELR9_9BURK|nr:6-phosphogluconolactonase [Cupriavidus plantarum]NYI02264.1 6-phosphogluconolactonase [Cupriavidus plantarum]PWK33079.1 6-phosphogluconolactonase [Cupriavidus plantarum]REE88776.1 6-phosphogluconolactonase [Cupriavidus plantarum]RLK31080.1 6-phosphogluconolactonase [Cupriavidus plantarum]CAG2146372.1 Glucosamine-6-phosphate deaminase [Cupriavidus plantarum]